MKITSFTGLKAWQEGHKLVLEIYKVTDKYPSKEGFGLTSQMRRAAISVTSNIAEGFGRTSKKDKINFYRMAKGSLYELQNQIILSKDLKYIDKDNFKYTADQTIAVSRLITGLIKSADDYKNH